MACKSTSDSTREIHAQTQKTPEKLEAMTTALAKMLGMILSFKDWDDAAGECDVRDPWEPRMQAERMTEEQRHEKKRADNIRTLRRCRLPLIDLIYNEYNLFTAWKREDMDAFSRRRRIKEMADESLAAALLMEKECKNPREKNVVVTPFALLRPFHTVMHSEEEGWELGNIGGKLCDCVCNYVMPWLIRLDEQLCRCGGREYGPMNAELRSLVEQFATAISNRHTLMQARPKLIPEVDPLTSRFLEMRAEVEFARSTPAAETLACVDLKALTHLLELATRGSKSVEAQRIISMQLEYISHVIKKPPSELGLHGAHADRMNLHLLDGILSPALRFQDKCAIVENWHLKHGAYAAHAIAQAQLRLRNWSPQKHKGFIKVLEQCCVDEHGKCRNVDEEVYDYVIECMPWAHSNLRWRIMSKPRCATRTGLDADGERIVRFTSAVWQLIADGAFEQGVVASDIVKEVVKKVNIDSNLMILSIKQYIDWHGQGSKLLEMLEHLYDRESALSDQVRRALCEVRNFSTFDVFSVFNVPAQRDPVLHALSNRTREHMVAKVPAAYTRFAIEALAILLPLLRQQREALVISPLTTPSNMGELLRSVPGLRQRVDNANESVISLDARAVAAAHPETRRALDEAAAHGDVVRAAHLTKTGKQRKRAVTFWINCDALEQLMRE